MEVHGLAAVGSSEIALADWRFGLILYFFGTGRGVCASKVLERS